MKSRLLVVRPKGSLFDVLLGDNRIAAAAAGSEIEEKKALANVCSRQKITKNLQKGPHWSWAGNQMGNPS
jgi:hypothetical protein